MSATYGGGAEAHMTTQAGSVCRRFLAGFLPNEIWTGCFCWTRLISSEGSAAVVSRALACDDDQVA